MRNPGGLLLSWRYEPLNGPGRYGPWSLDRP